MSRVICTQTSYLPVLQNRCLYYIIMIKEWTRPRAMEYDCNSNRRRRVRMTADHRAAVKPDAGPKRVDAHTRVLY